MARKREVRFVKFVGPKFNEVGDLVSDGYTENHCKGYFEYWGIKTIMVGEGIPLTNTVAIIVDEFGETFCVPPEMVVFK